MLQRIKKARRPAGTEDDDPGEGDRHELDDEALNRIKTFAEGVFGTIIADEAHKLESTRTITLRSVLVVKANVHILLTATPMMNRPLDFLGLLSTRQPYGVIGA